MTERSLYLLLSGASTSSSGSAADLVRLLQEEGWKVTALCTPTGVRFHDLDVIADFVGEPVRVDFRLPGTGKSLPPPDVVLACPWSFNSTNKLAQGLADNFALALACEMIGRAVPMVVVPKAGAPLAAHPAFERSLRDLRAIPSVSVLRSDDGRLPSWKDVVEAVNAATV